MTPLAKTCHIQFYNICLMNYFKMMFSEINVNNTMINIKKTKEYKVSGK